MSSTYFAEYILKEITEFTTISCFEFLKNGIRSLYVYGEKEFVGSTYYMNSEEKTGIPLRRKFKIIWEKRGRKEGRKEVSW